MFFIGEDDGTLYIWLKEGFLNRDILSKITVNAERFVIAANALALSKETLEKYHIAFLKVGRDISYKELKDKKHALQNMKNAANRKLCYVCYEVNNHGFAIECGTVNEIKLFDNPEKAKLWFLERVNEGKEYGIFPDSEDEKVSESRSVDEAILFDRIVSGYASLVMFAGYQENWDESYEIIVEAERIR